jgi:TonB family protein
MFERLPASQFSHADPRDTALTLFSLLLHASVGGTLILSSWLALPEVALPRLRPILVTPVLLTRAGALAPKLGSQNPSPVPRAADLPPVQPPEKLQPPREIPPLPPEERAEVAAAGGSDSPDGLGPGDPNGVPNGDPLGKKGGVCVGDDCDPAGPVGLGPGMKGGTGEDASPEILLPGTSDVTEPVLVESSKIIPIYPELARRAGVTGQVILQAVIRPDGTVASLTVLRENPPRIGFADAAREAVSRWRYRPALQHGIPVAVYFTVTIDFTLSR